MNEYQRLESGEDMERPVTQRPKIFSPIYWMIALLLFYVTTRTEKRVQIVKTDDAADLCKPFTSESSCESSDSDCVWCESGAIPSRCYPVDLAHKLPSGVFNCHFPSEFVVNLHQKDDEDEESERLCDKNVNQASGYFSVDHSTKNYFFWFFESRSVVPEEDPVVLWLTGGPGCSSELALFVENGPCSVNKEGSDTIPNPYSWNSKANLIYVDQPSGTGFSFGSKKDVNEEEIGRDMTDFLVQFFSKFPRFAKSPLFVAGESYAGHYVPAVGHSISRTKTKKEINLQGILIGNGLTDPEVQYRFYPDMAAQTSTIEGNVARVGEDEVEEMREQLPECIEKIESCDKEMKNSKEVCEEAVEFCNEKMIDPYMRSGYNQYDMRKKCEVEQGLCYDFSHVNKYLHREEVLDYLGVDEKKRDWEECDDGAHRALLGDWMKNYQTWVSELLDEYEVRVLVYAGDVDYIVNYLGCRAWPLELEWSGKAGYRSVKERAWWVEGREAGKIRKYGNLSFLQVYQAGHMVPMDKPKEALSMLVSFMEDRLD